MRTRFERSTLLCAGVLGLLSLGAPDALAQVTGRVYLTSQQVPESAKGKALRTHLRKHRLSVLKKSDDANGWTAYGFAKLRIRPSNKLMKLTHNDGKIQIVVRKRVGKRWVLTKVGTFDYSKRTRLVRFELSLPDGHGIAAGKKTKLQLMVQNKRKRRISLAHTTFSIR